MRKVGLSLVLAALCAACGHPAWTVASRPRVPDDAGLVHVYLRTWPRESGATTIVLDGAWAVREGGERVPLDLELARIGHGTRSGERLLARGRVAPGRFEALILRTSPEALELRAGVPFVIARERGTVLEAALDARAGPDEGAPPRIEASARIAPPTTIGALALVADRASNVLLLVDKRTGIVGGAVPTGRGPTAVALDTDRRRAYVVTSLDEDVEAVDLDQPIVASKRALRVGDRPAEIALLPDRQTLVVVNRGSGTLAFVETEGLAEIDRIDVGNGPSSIEIDDEGRLGYVFNSQGSSVTVVHLPSRQIAATIPVDPGPVRGQLDRARTRLWVLHDGSPFLTGIDTRRLVVDRRIHLGVGATAMRVDLRTDHICVARRDGTGIDVYDPLSLLPVDTLALVGRADYLTIDAETNLLAASVPEERCVRTLGLLTRAPGWVLDVEEPAYVRIVGAR